MSLLESLDEAREVHPLAPAVLDQLGWDDSDDATKLDAIRCCYEASEHGADGGFGGFIYYSEAEEFFRGNRAAILECLQEVAAELAVDIMTLVAGFRCLSDVGPDEIGSAIWGNEDDEAGVRNALAWFALEEVGHALESGASLDDWLALCPEEDDEEDEQASA